MFWIFMLVLFVILVDFKLFLGLLRVGGFFIVGIMIGTYLFGTTLSWMLS